MPFHVMHGHGRHIQGPRQSACTGGSDQQRADQSWAGCVRDAINISALQLGLIKTVLQQGPQFSNVISAGQLGHHAAVLGMQIDLAVQGMRKQTALSAVQREAGFVTGSFDANNDQC